MKKLTEGLDYLDMEHQIKDTFTIDEYAAKSGSDSDIVTLTFTVYSKLAARDLVDWFEKGYDFVIDASISDGEIKPGQYLVFVEILRRSKIPSQVVELLNELDTLTGRKIKDWVVSIDGEEFDPDPEIISQKLLLNPNEYRALNDEELDNIRTIAGVDKKKEDSNKSGKKADKAIEDMKNIAGI